jgi:hypothetical protein
MSLRTLQGSAVASSAIKIVRALPHGTLLPSYNYVPNIKQRKFLPSYADIYFIIEFIALNRAGQLPPEQEPGLDSVPVTSALEDKYIRRP